MPSSTHEITIIASSFRTIVEMKKLKVRRQIKIPPTWEPIIPIDTSIYNVHIDSNDVLPFFMKRGESNVRSSFLQNGHELGEENKLSKGCQLKLTFLSDLSNPLDGSTLRWNTYSYHSSLRPTQIDLPFQSFESFGWKHIKVEYILLSQLVGL